MRVGEWNLADHDNYSEELQVETLCILYLDIYLFYSISSLHIYTIFVSNYLQVERVVAHPNFRPNGFYNDIAVFTLKRPVTFSQ